MFGVAKTILANHCSETNSLIVHVVIGAIENSIVNATANACVNFNGNANINVNAILMSLPTELSYMPLMHNVIWKKTNGLI